MAIRDTLNDYSTGITDGPYLIIGLGNVGDDYEMTRHNAGFMAVDRFASMFDLGKFTEKKDLNAEIIETNMAGEKVILAKPNTFMNKSGLAVVKLQNYFAVNDPRILVVYDDVDVDFKTIRNRIGGKNAGHNGVKSIEQVIGSNFARVRIGVRNEHLKDTDTAAFVLAQFNRSGIKELDAILDHSAKQIEAFIENRFEETSHSI